MWCRSEPPALHTQYQLVGSQRDPPAPQKIPTRTPASVRKPSNTHKNPQFSVGANSHLPEPQAPYHEPPKPGPHLQPLSVPGRVTSSSNTESITDTEEVVALVRVVHAPLDPLRVATRPTLQVPAPSNGALVRTLAAPLEFKPQPPPSFPALLPTETRRGQ